MNMMTVTLKGYWEKRLFGSARTAHSPSSKKGTQAAKQSNVVGIENRRQDRAHSFTSLCSTPTNIVNDPILVSLFDLTTFEGQPVFFHSQSRQAGA